MPILFVSLQQNYGITEGENGKGALLGRDEQRHAAVAGMNNGMQQLLGLVFGIILGRLLSPSDYGLIAMITIFSLIATALQNSGFSTALVNEKEPKDSDYNSVFWFNILMGGSIYLILFFSAPFIADYYQSRDWCPFVAMPLSDCCLVVLA